MSQALTITRSTQVAFGMDCRKKTEQFIGYSFREMPIIATCIYLTPHWMAYQMPSGEIAIIVEKPMSQVIHILPDWQALHVYKYAPMPDPETGRYTR